MNQLEVGTIQMMTVDKYVDTGYILKKGNEQALMLQEEVEGSLELGEEIDVFLFHDKHGKINASPKIPSMVIGSFDWARVTEVVGHLGVFVDIGTTKEVLVSIDDLPFYQEVWPQVDDRLYVTLDKDKRGRLLAIPASEAQLEINFQVAEEIALNDRISGYIYFTSKEGSALITEEGYRGFIHHTEREQEPRLGEHVTGRVIEVKENGTLNMSLMPMKHERLDDDAEAILHYIKENGGQMPYGDKTEPDVIRKHFYMSKSAFKRALGRLMKKQAVTQKDGITYLMMSKDE